MKNKAAISGVIFLIFLIAGCAGFGSKSPTQLAKEYTAKAQAYEKKGDLVEALKQYKLVLTVDPQNKLAQEKRATLEPQLNKLAEEHYQIGLKYYRQGQYPPARKEFLTALRYNPEHAEAKDKLTAARKEIEHVKRYIVHTLQADETISTLAERYYGDYRKFHLIAEYNELEDATKVTVGQEIKIPVIEGTPIIADPATIQTDSGEVSETLPGEVITVKRYIIHTVRPNESLSKLAMMYYGDYGKFDVIAKFNSIEDGTSVRVGQELKIPEVTGLPFLVKGEAEDTKTAVIPKEPAVTEAVPKKEEAIADQTANYRELGIELYNKKEYADAIIEFNKVLNVTPADKVTLNYLAKSHFEQGLVLFGKEDYLAARDEFKTSLQYDKNCEQCAKNIQKCEATYKGVHYDMGLAYFGDQKLADAIREWESVSAIDPNYKDVDKNLTKARNLLERLESIKRSKAQENTQ
jgi:tetratricopeptide (TPR) repeat protein